MRGCAGAGQARQAPSEGDGSGGGGVGRACSLSPKSSGSRNTVDALVRRPSPGDSSSGRSSRHWACSITAASALDAARSLEWTQACLMYDYITISTTPMPGLVAVGWGKSDDRCAASALA